MKNLTKICLLALMLFLTVWSLNCASSPIVSPPLLESRTLRISPDFAGFEYQYEVCEKAGIFGGCVKRAVKKDLYDMNDSDMRKRLILMGFVLKVRDKS